MLFGASIEDKEKNNCKLDIANTGIEYSKITKYLRQAKKNITNKPITCSI